MAVKSCGSRRVQFPWSQLAFLRLSWIPLVTAIDHLVVWPFVIQDHECVFHQDVEDHWEEEEEVGSSFSFVKYSRHHLEFCCKIHLRWTHFSCSIMHLGIVLTDIYRRMVRFGGCRNVLRRQKKKVTNWGVSQGGWRWECGRVSEEWLQTFVRWSLFLLMLVRWHWVRPSHYSVCGGSCLWVKQDWSTCESDGVVSCWLIVSRFMNRLWTVAHELFSQFSVFLRIPFLTKTPFGMQEGHLKENWRKSPSRYQTSWRTMPERGGRDWDGRASSSLAVDAASSTSERVKRAESGVCVCERNLKCSIKNLNVTSDDLWRIRDKLDGKIRILSRSARRRGKSKSNLIGTSTNRWKCSPKAVLVASGLRTLMPGSKKTWMWVWESSATISRTRPQRFGFWHAARMTVVTMGSSICRKPWLWCGLFARQGYARRRLRGGRDGEVGDMVSERWICVTDMVRQAKLSLGETDRL